MLKRCHWVNLNNPIYIDYHDNIWWVPVCDDRLLFEFLALEWAQAGLSWEIILGRREWYIEAFDQFDVEKISKYSDSKIQKLTQNPRIIRNKRKINSTIKNARVFLDIQESFSSFSKYLWWFRDRYADDELAVVISKDLKSRWMSFVGETIIQSYIEAMGLLNHHDRDCFRYLEIEKLKNY